MTTLARRIDTALSWAMKSRGSSPIRVTEGDVAACVTGATVELVRLWRAGLAAPSQRQIVELAAAAGVNFLWLVWGHRDTLVLGRSGAYAAAKKRCRGERSDLAASA